MHSQILNKFVCFAVLSDKLYFDLVKNLCDGHNKLCFCHQISGFFFYLYITSSTSMMSSSESGALFGSSSCISCSSNSKTSAIIMNFECPHHNLYYQKKLFFCSLNARYVFRVSLWNVFISSHLSSLYNTHFATVFFLLMFLSGFFYQVLHFY